MSELDHALMDRELNAGFSIASSDGCFLLAMRTLGDRYSVCRVTMQQFAEAMVRKVAL